MLELDTSLAQYIVDRAMTILPNNINVMDTNGMIIGSGDPERLHTRHEGAQLVLANQRVVEIDEQAATCLQGVRPGVNLPLMHEGRLVGVLGITGDPEQVRPLAELVRMTAEMLVEQRMSHAQWQWQNQQQEAWLAHLLDEGYALSRLQTDAERLGLTLNWPRQPWLISLDEQADKPAAQIRLMVQMRARTPQQAILPLGTDALLWLRAEGETSTPTAWLQQAERRGWSVGRLYVAESVNQLADLREACQALLALRDFADELRLPHRQFELTEYRLASLLHSQRHSWTVRRLLAPLEQLRAGDPHGVLLHTLREWLVCNGQVQSCAGRLGIHRNTLRYRLERIAELSGLELARSEHCQQLALGLALTANSG